MKFYIYTPGYSPTIGGSIALNVLAENIRRCGEEAYLSYKSEMPEGAVVVYPETTLGNPLSSDRVIRWVLSTPGYVGKDRTASWSANDSIFTYTTYYARNLRPDGILTAYDWKFDEWGNDGLERKGDCFAVRKGKNLNLHDPSAVSIDGYKSNASLRASFNRCQRFISYDDQTMLSLQAALCGCQSIIIPTTDLTAEQWRTAFPYFRYGVAYGLPDLAYATKTVGLVRGHLQSLQELSLVQTQDFINKAKERWT